MSGGNVWYHLRPNKTVERQLFIELLSRLNRFVPISNYCYVSFGGAYLEDFKLVHSHFANTKMISIEADKHVYDRQKFNLPHACIQMENCTSGTFISERIDNENNNIVWLDYADASKTYQQLTEFQSLLAKSKTYDIVKITLNCNPSSLFDGSRKKENGISYSTAELNDRRLAVLSERIGDFLPNDVTSDQMARDIYPGVLNRVIGMAASQIIAMVDRSLRFQPLTSFFYGDSDNQMITVCGIIIPYDEIKGMLASTGISGWDLGATRWGEVQSIQLPALTAREKFALDQKIPAQDFSEVQNALGFVFEGKSKIHDTVLVNYQKYYRYYPSFHKIVY